MSEYDLGIFWWWPLLDAIVSIRSRFFIIYLIGLNLMNVSMVLLAAALHLKMFQNFILKSSMMRGKSSLERNSGVKIFKIFCQLCQKYFTFLKIVDRSWWISSYSARNKLHKEIGRVAGGFFGKIEKRTLIEANKPDKHKLRDFTIKVAKLAPPIYHKLVNRSISFP